MRFQQYFKCIRGVAFGLFYGVDVAVGGFELGMVEAGGYVLDIRAVTQQQRRGGVAEGVELPVRQAIALLELREPLRRRGRVHRLAVRLNEYPVIAAPRVAERKPIPVLFGAVAAQHPQAVRRDHNAPGSPGLGRFALDLRVAGELVVAAADGQHARFEINIAPFQTHQLAAAAACIQRHMNEQPEHQRFTFKRLEQIGKFLFGKDFRLLLLELRQGYALAFGGIDSDQAELVGAFHQRANHRIIAANSRGRELARLAVKVRIALCQVVDEALNVNRADVPELQMPERRDNAEVDDMGV